MNEPRQKYFWFKLNDIKLEIAKEIAKKLEGIMAYLN